MGEEENFFKLLQTLNSVGKKGYINIKHTASCLILKIYFNLII